jgi:hypothetical protein
MKREKSPHAQAAAHIRRALKDAGIRAEVRLENIKSLVSGGAYLHVKLLDLHTKGQLTVAP